MTPPHPPRFGRPPPARPAGPGPAEGGVALISVLIVTVLVFMLVVTTSSVVVRDATETRNDASATRLALLADGASDVARLTLFRNYQDSQMTLGAWLDSLAPCRDTSGCVPLAGTLRDEVAALQGRHLREQDGSRLTWAVTEVSPQGPQAWVRLAATATDASGGQQTVLRRVEFGSTNIFELAMLSDTTNCMFCHLKVNGDVGSTAFFRPGWGTEGVDGFNTGRGSAVNGRIYAAQTVTADRTLNGLEVTGGTVTNYTGSKLPHDTTGDGVPDFPGLDAALARRSATGSASGGVIRVIPLGGALAGASTVGSVRGAVDGNLILEGTATDPIVLDRDLYATGDVVIRGYVTGRGAVYAGRNLYVAGNLENVRRADQPGQGLCRGIPNPEACARANIADRRDETRLAAANNIVLGDYTNEDAAGQPLGPDRLQANDYIRAQFGLSSGVPRYVRRGTSQELRLIAGSYVDGMGRTVPPGDVVTYGSGSDPYAPLIKPGTTTAAGRFVPWLSDAEYASILGTEEIDHNTWRMQASSRSAEALADELLQAGLPSCNASGLSCAPAAPGTAEGLAELIAAKRSGSHPFAGRDRAGRPVSGTLSYDRGTLRVAINEARRYPTETTRLDAFLYANSRIAGRLSPRGGHVNGGMIAREIGVLAPGKNASESWWKTGLGAPDLERYTTCDPTVPSDTTPDAANSASGRSCDFAINYDHRMRNGGYGFNLIRAVTGSSSEWRLDTDGANAVQP